MIFIEIDIVNSPLLLLLKQDFILMSMLHTSDSNTSCSVCRCIIEFGEGAATAVETPPSTVSSRKRKKKRNRPKNIYDTLADSRTWLPSTVLKHLKGGKENNEAGWLQKEVEKALKVSSTPIGQLK